MATRGVGSRGNICFDPKGFLQGAKKGGEAVKSTNAYRTASYKAQELKQTEAYKEAANSSAGRFAQEAWRELRGQNRLQK